MSQDADEPHGTAAVSGEHLGAPIGSMAAAEALKHGPRGAISLALLLLGWLAFYFLLFLPRGPIG